VLFSRSSWHLLALLFENIENIEQSSYFSIINISTRIIRIVNRAVDLDSTGSDTSTKVYARCAQGCGGLRKSGINRIFSTFLLSRAPKSQNGRPYLSKNAKAVLAICADSGSPRQIYIRLASARKHHEPRFARASRQRQSTCPRGSFVSSSFLHLTGRLRAYNTF
jgi:hypothetical protein